jgi:hypothetical protein
MAWGGLDATAAGHLVSVCMKLGDTSTIADLSAALPGLDG